MSGFSYKEVYMENGKRVLEVNILPEKHCNFDCIFCPIGRSKNKVDSPKTFDDADKALSELEDKLTSEKPEIVFINSAGEALVNDKIEQIINVIQSKGIIVRLLSNGYILNQAEYIEIANQCEEVIGEIKVVTDEDFQRIQRPIQGYTLDKYIANMAAFNKQYNGKFIFEITIIKGYNDDQESVDKLKQIISEIRPDELVIIGMEDEPFKKKLGISDERLEAIRSELIDAHNKLS